MSRGRQRARRDSLPENTRYADTGCHLHPSCLHCPLERCYYDENVRHGAADRRVRNAALLRAGGEGATPSELATAFGLSRRTVFRVLGEGRRRY